MSDMYRVVSETGLPVSRHRSVEAAARVIAKASAQRVWGIRSESHGVLTKDEQARARRILYPAISKFDSKAPEQVKEER